MPTARAIYVHIPFCVAKCHYCGFTSFPGQESLHQQYVSALIEEIALAESLSPVATIYFGGGTPTTLSAEQLTSILSAIFESFDVEGTAEITLEANPGTIDLAKAAALRGARFNRISLGVQSLDDRRLRKIGRIHTSQEALDAYQAVRQAGFANVSIDLIFALPTQTLAEWQNTLNRAVQLNPEHASLYELSIEEGAKFAEAYKAGLLIMPDEDTRLEMYESAIAALTGAGYEHYEVSNFAKPGFRSRHNQVYWKNESYFGFGAGAVRYLDGVRCTMTTSVEDYISRIQQGLDPADSCEELTGSALMGETIMLGLRTSDGVDLRAFEERFSTSLIEAYDEVLPVLYNDRLIDLTDTHLRLTHKGLLMADRVAAEFIV